MENIKIALIGTYPPRKCGIANFTFDLNDGLKKNGVITEIIAIHDELSNYSYPSEVSFIIDQNNLLSYINAAYYINNNCFDAVLLQHEFGIFGGVAGQFIIQLLKRINIPVFTTFHTISDSLPDNYQKVMYEIGSLSTGIISISQRGIKMLNEIFQIPYTKCCHIYHGVPKINGGQKNILKTKLGFENRKIILSFGLLSRNKSVEVVLNALQRVKEKFPDVIYIYLGQTHPHVLHQEGEKYREYLLQLVKELNLKDHVRFINQFISNEELFEYLKICDIYVIPYLGEKQISSGTLMYAFSAAKPVVSTPFWYAQEILSDNRGLIFNFGNSHQLSDILIDLLSNYEKRKYYSKRALELAKECYWPVIGQKYFKFISSLINQKKHYYQVSLDSNKKLKIPNINLQHIKTLTDDTGIIQHARYCTPDRTHGYCLDDNARALLLMVLLKRLLPVSNELYKLTLTYLSFIDYAYNPMNGKFRNFMNYNRQWLEEEGSEDSLGRVIWSLAHLISYTDDVLLYHHANDLFEKTLPILKEMFHPRALAYAVLGLSEYTDFNSKNNIMHLFKEKTLLLSSFFDSRIDSDWPWFDDLVTYDNSRIAEALIVAGNKLNLREVTRRGKILLDWLISKQFEVDYFSPIGNQGWLTPQRKSQFDQQPLEAYGMIDACLKANKIFNNSKYLTYAFKAFNWFVGENNLGIPLYNPQTGGCFDGLHPDRVNLNQGAESTLSFLLSQVNILLYLNNHNHNNNNDKSEKNTNLYSTHNTQNLTTSFCSR